MYVYIYSRKRTRRRPRQNWIKRERWWSRSHRHIPKGFARGRGRRHKRTVGKKAVGEKKGLYWRRSNSAAVPLRTLRVSMHTWHTYRDTLHTRLAWLRRLAALIIESRGYPGAAGLDSWFLIKIAMLRWCDRYVAAAKDTWERGKISNWTILLRRASLSRRRMKV